MERTICHSHDFILNQVWIVTLFCCVCCTSAYRKLFIQVLFKRCYVRTPYRSRSCMQTHDNYLHQHKIKIITLKVSNNCCHQQQVFQCTHQRVVSEAKYRDTGTNACNNNIISIEFAKVTKWVKRSQRYSVVTHHLRNTEQRETFEFRISVNAATTHANTSTRAKPWHWK